MTALRKDQKLLVALVSSIAISAWIIIFELITDLWRTWVYSLTFYVVIFTNAFLFLFYAYFGPKQLLYDSRVTLKRVNLGLALILVAFPIIIVFEWWLSSHLGLSFPDIDSIGSLVFFLFILTDLALIRHDIKRKMGQGLPVTGA